MNNAYIVGRWIKMDGTDPELPDDIFVGTAVFVNRTDAVAYRKAKLEVDPTTNWVIVATMGLVI